jgi:tetratricopeptide (TPR) repeat protein
VRTLVAVRRACASIAAAAVSLAAPSSVASSSADELVRQAREHEAAHEEDIAVRRYTEALTLDPASEGAWLGLGALRLKIGEAAEAERVFQAALDRMPSMHSALEGRARARWSLGRHSDAETDLETYAVLEGDVAALHELADWFASDGRTPAQLATWRRLHAMALIAGDEAGEHEARTMVRALVILVDGGDPAASPITPDATRQALRSIARRGG